MFMPPTDVDSSHQHCPLWGAEMTGYQLKISSSLEKFLKRKPQAKVNKIQGKDIAGDVGVGLNWAEEAGQAKSSPDRTEGEEAISAIFSF